MAIKAVPNQQPYPETKVFIGAVLYSASAYETESGIETGIDQWVVRTIRARRNSKTRYGFSIHLKGYEEPKMVNLVQKNACTWGKVSKKSGDYGWQKNISASFRKQFPVGHTLPFGIYTTKRAALIYRIAVEFHSKTRLEKYISDCDDDEEKAELVGEMVIQDRLISALQRRMKALAKT